MILAKIIDWLNQNNGSIMVIITAIYVVATIAICIFNKRSADAAREQAEQSQKALQKSIDLQLFDRMIAVSNKLENDDYSSTTMEISVLFGIPILNQVNKLKRSMAELDIWKKKREKYTSLCEAQGYDYNLEYEAGLEGAAEETIKAAEEQDAKFTVVYDYESYYPEEGLEAEEYDWKEICSSIKNLEEEIQKDQQQLKRDVYTILKSKITI